MKVFGIDLSSRSAGKPRIFRRRDATGENSRALGLRGISQRQRRIVAAAALGLAVMLLAWALVPSTGAGTAVVVAARTVPAGAKLSSSDVRIESYPDNLVPHDHVQAADDVVGKTASHQLTSGMPLTTNTVMGPGSTRLDGGHVLVPVSIPDTAAAAVLAPGHRIRVYVAGGDPTEIAQAGSVKSSTKSGLDDNLKGDARTLVPEAVVTAVRKPQAAGLAAETGTVVTLSVPEERAARLAGVASGGLGFALLN